MDEQSQKIKVGDREYTHEELADLVKTGEFTKEVERRQNTKVENLMGAYTRDTQRMKQMEEELAELRTSRAQAQSQSVSNGDLSEDQVRLVREQLHKVGALTQENVDRVLDKIVQDKFMSMMAGKDLIEQAKSAAKEAKSAWGIEPEVQDILEFMEQEGVKNPTNAIKLKYEAQIEKAREQQIKDARGQGLATTTTSRIGSKEPEYDLNFKDRDQVEKAVDEILRGEG